MSAPFKHDVPLEEPPIGTVCDFRGGFATGGAYSSGLLIRTTDGWCTSTHPSGPHQVKTWAELTDLKTINAAILERMPSSTAKVVAVAVERVAAGGPALEQIQYDAWFDGHTALANGLCLADNPYDGFHPDHEDTTGGLG